MPIFVKASRRGNSIVKAYQRGGGESMGRARRSLFDRMGQKPTRTPLSLKRLGDLKHRATEPGLSRNRRRIIQKSFKSLRTHGVVRY